jgi:hypothetical protein
MKQILRNIKINAPQKLTPYSFTIYDGLVLISKIIRGDNNKGVPSIFYGELYRQIIMFIPILAR